MTGARARKKRNRSSEQRIALLLGAAIAITAIVWLLRAVNPELGTGAFESSWAPAGLRGLLTMRGLLALTLALTALALLILAFRPGRRATPATFFTEEEKRAILDAINAAEDHTAGEIRVHLARRTDGDVLEAAKGAFLALGMQATRARTGVLIYLSVEDHRFAIFGDEGIDRIVPEGYWDEIKDMMQRNFAADRFAEGISEAARQIGQKLRTYFPIQEGDIDELSDEISTES